MLCRAMTIFSQPRHFVELREANTLGGDDGHYHSRVIEVAAPLRLAKEAVADLPAVYSPLSAHCRPFSFTLRATATAAR